LLEQFKTYSKASIPLHCADLSNPPSHLKNQFDVIIGFFVLHHLTDMEEIFQSLSTLLKPNGQILFVEPNPYNPLFYLQILFHPKMRWKNERYILSMRPSRLCAAMQGASMQNFKHHRFGFFPPFVSQFSWGAKLESTLEKFRPFRKILPFQVFYGEKLRDKL
jgi:SAM-dependent methyltransferase